MTTIDDKAWIAECEEQNYKLALIEVEMALSSLINAWGSRKPIKPHLDQGKYALKELQRLRIDGYYSIVCREAPSKLEPAREAISEQISLTATEKKEDNHSVLHYDLENSTVTISTEEHEYLPRLLAVYVPPFHPPSDGGLIKVVAHLYSVVNGMAFYSLEIDRSDS
jgi:hypothetical protein